MILLTGGLGFLGSNLAYVLARKGESVVLTQHRISRIPSFLEPLMGKNIFVSPCDILDFSKLFGILEKYPITSIIHAASMFGHKENLYQSLNVNILGTMNVLEAGRIKKLKRIMFTSSQSVYQREREKWHVEDENLPLASPHTISLTKKIGDMICEYYRKEYGMDVLVTRPSQIYGPLYSSARNPLQKMVEHSVAGIPTYLPEVAPDDGNNLIYVKDCARAIALIHLADHPLSSAYNIGDRYICYREMADMVKRILPEAQIGLGENAKDKIQEPIYLNMDRLHKEFGFRIEYDLERGIRDYIEWLRDGKY